jgi:hydroxyacyl-ACP dehydratase HTD2-like protein with hotdog domain
MINNDEKLRLPQGHHLVYFPLQLPPSELMPDGTDPGHCPGEPFTRRMWAGGEIKFMPGWEEKLRLDGRRGVCVETVVKQPVMKWENDEGKEKVFVDVKRLYYANGEEAEWAMHAREENAAVHEVRKLVFMREPGPAPEGGVKKAEVGRVVRGGSPFPPLFSILFWGGAVVKGAGWLTTDPSQQKAHNLLRRQA